MCAYARALCVHRKKKNKTCTPANPLISSHKKCTDWTKDELVPASSVSRADQPAADVEVVEASVGCFLTGSSPRFPPLAVISAHLLHFILHHTLFSQRSGQFTRFEITPPPPTSTHPPTHPSVKCSIIEGL